MKRTSLFLVFLSLLATNLAAQFAFEEKAKVTMVADRTAYDPGATVRAAAVMKLDKKWHANANPPTLEYLIATELTLELPAGAAGPAVTYPAGEMMSFVFAPEPISVYEGTVFLQAEFTLPDDAQPGTLKIPAAVRYQACDDKQCVAPVSTEATLELRVGSGGQASAHPAFGDGDGGGGTGDSGPAAHVSTTSAAAPRSLIALLLTAVLGGLILNAMPCVLPVLSLKVFGMIQSAEHGRRHVVTASLATAAGILASFWALAAVAVAAKSAGAAVGWGIQFQQPGFVAFLMVVVVLFSLNLWGVFEIPLPQALSRVGGPQGDGVAGHFASGLFATLMATPCSAPFLGTAVGFALGRPASTIFLVFTAVGVGLALPYLVLAAVPGSARFLPKPGTWMVTLRGVLGFILAGSAVWLFFVLAGQVGAVGVAKVQLTVLVLALLTWLTARFAAGSLGRKVLTFATLAAATATVLVAINAKSVTGGGATASARHEWIAFDEREAERLAADGSLVFVDVTADWCLTCKTNEHLVLETDEIDQAFDRHQVVTMKADWTNRDDVITDYLGRFGRSSIPFYVLYRPGNAPHVFGELLTKQRVLDALAESTSVAAQR